MSTMRPGMLLHCETHRGTVWLGHFECALDAGGCGRVFRVIAKAPLVCECGHRLLPVDRQPRENDARFSGRVLCALCFGGVRRSSAPVSSGGEESSIYGD